VVTIKSSESHDPWQLDVEIDGTNPVILVVSVEPAHLTQLAPRLKIVIGELAIFNINDFSHFAVQKNKSPSRSHHADRHVMAIQHKHARIEHTAALFWTHCGLQILALGNSIQVIHQMKTTFTSISIDVTANTTAHAEIHASGLPLFYPVDARQASLILAATLSIHFFSEQSACPAWRMRITMKSVANPSLKALL